MAKGYIGESRGERAENKMIKHIERSDRNTERADEIPIFKSNPIVDQLKATYGKDWEYELKEIRRENADPDYKAAKAKIRQDAKKAYLGMTRRDRDLLGISEAVWITKAITNWKLTQLKQKYYKTNYYAGYNLYHYLCMDRNVY